MASQGPGPVVIHFRTGLIKPSVSKNQGILIIDYWKRQELLNWGKAAKGSVTISITPRKRLMSGVPGFKKSKEADGTFSYQAPLALRQLVSIAGVNMNGVDNAIVEYTWKWVPNQLGDVFDAGGPLVKSFNLWERQTLINKYEVAFYNGEPTKSTLALARSGREWKISKQ